MDIDLEYQEKIKTEMPLLGRVRVISHTESSSRH